MRAIAVLLLGLFTLGCTPPDDVRIPLDEGWAYAPGDHGQLPADLRETGFTPLAEHDLLQLETLLPDGVVWLRTRFTYPGPHSRAAMLLDSAEAGLAGLYLGRVSMADQTFLNGIPVGSTGRFPPDWFSAWNTYRDYRFSAGLLREQNTLLIKVYVGHEGSLVDEAYIAHPDYTARHARLNGFIANHLNLGIALVLLVVALYHLWLYRKRTRDRENLTFALLSVAAAVYLSNFFITILPHWELWTVSYTAFQRLVANAMVYVIGLLSALFVRDFLRRREPLLLTLLLFLFTAVPVAMSFLLPDYASLREMRPTMQAFLIPVLGYIAYMLLHSALRRNRDALVLMLGIAPLLLTVVADFVIHSYLELHHFPYIGGFGLPLMMFALLFILAGRSAAARSETEYLNLNLERQVAARTRELSETNLVLREAMEELERAQRISARDMQMAARVQNSFFPARAPQRPPWQLGLVFQPAAGVSGDFYDFYAGPHDLHGVALFDVSGHGVASGLVAMLAKAIIARTLQGGSEERLPAIMQEINRRIIAEKGDIDNYMTGILLRLQENRVELANAGHSVPLLRSAASEQVRPLGGADAQGSIIGAPGLPARYPTVRFSMQRDDLLVLYSDALTETTNKQGTPFGQDALRKSLQHAGAMPAQDVAERLAGDLRLFADHSDPLRDDLTIIALRRLL